MTSAAVSQNPAGGTAKTNAFKTIAVNFIIAFAGYWAYQASKEGYQSYKANKAVKTT